MITDTFYGQSSSITQPRIMVVDDNPSNILLITRVLKSGGYNNILSITDSAEVIDRFKSWQPDIILLDLLMPRFSGLDILDQINSMRNRQYLPVIMITADNDIENRIKALETGANDYLSKPFEAKELLARIKNLIKVKESMDQALATETAFLQAQIKPHFIYNTLNTISSLCGSNPDKASGLIDDFAEYLRQSFDLKNLELFVPVAREISLVQSYIEIQKARFCERLDFEMKVACNTEWMIPPLCIQPLVENSIKHGLKEKDDIRIRMELTAVPEGILISVTDNGRGISKKNLENILVKTEGKGIGLWNIDARLKKNYGRGLIVESKRYNGTKVSFVIPAENI